MRIASLSESSVLTPPLGAAGLGARNPRIWSLKQSCEWQPSISVDRPSPPVDGGRYERIGYHRAAGRHLPADRRGVKPEDVTNDEIS